MLRYQKYEGEEQLPEMIALIEKDLSEPYSVYTYRYFLLNFPDLSYLVFDNDRCVGVIISKIDEHRNRKRGYIGMLAVDSEYRGLGIGSQLVKLSLEAMIKETATEVCMETEVNNTGAIGLYESLGFIKDKRLFRYYLNGADAYRLKLMLSLPTI